MLYFLLLGTYLDLEEGMGSKYVACQIHSSMVTIWIFRST